MELTSCAVALIASQFTPVYSIGAAQRRISGTSTKMFATATSGVASRCEMDERHEEITSALPPDLDALPRSKGFRLRGMEPTRLETFIDAAFAFPITMLVIGGQQSRPISRAPRRVQKRPGLRHEHDCPGNFLARSLALEPALWTGRWRLDLDQLGHAGDHPDLHLPAQGGL